MALFGGKKKTEQIGNVIGGILDSQDTDIVVVRGRCETLYINKAARARMEGEGHGEPTCRDGYSRMFPELCDNCPMNLEHPPSLPYTVEVRNDKGRFFSATFNAMDWLDGNDAMAIYLRDIDAERTAKQKLYNLAYIDHLTGVPNRQKLKEDFEAILDDIDANRVCGVMAIFDLDNFKSINDTYGHNTGDIMLKRLTDHLMGEQAFKDHLYRLGGDEFVLLYTTPHNRFASIGDAKKYYEELMRQAFLSYTMPNIELCCTISMGAAFFPEHGDSYSELLRKADIALYQAKDGGRDRLVFFEDKYDTAKKFKDVFIGIQPILTQTGKTYGYELIDRGNEGEEEEDINLGGADRSLDELGLGELKSDAKYFISYSNALFTSSVMRNLPKDKFIIEITHEDGYSPELLKRWQVLHDSGFSLALTGVRGPDLPEEVLSLVEYIKFDPNNTDNYGQRTLIAAHPDKKFVALNVDSSDQFEAARRRGFKLFQGFFFDVAPVVKKTKEIDPLKVNYYRLMQLTSTDDYVDFREISEVISSDVALSYKLLRLLNSAALGLRNPISSIEMAVAYLGEEALKQWIAMLALRGIASDKPLELVRVSLIRARFGELLAPRFRPPRSKKHVFLVGLFSLLHIALEKTREEMLADIPVSDDIRESLLSKNGPHSDLLAFYRNYEYANWDAISNFAAEHGLTDGFINDCYIAAVKWYNDLAEE